MLQNHIQTLRFDKKSKRDFYTGSLSWFYESSDIQDMKHAEKAINAYNVSLVKLREKDTVREAHAWMVVNP